LKAGIRFLQLLKMVQMVQLQESNASIGADGGQSFVRRVLEIPFDGSTTEDKWVRIDGMVETDMPKSRSYGAIEPQTHGNVLFGPLEHGATRIGFAFTPERQKGHPEFNESAAISEAIQGLLQPGELVYSLLGRPKGCPKVFY
jgi:2-polyprenyl-6-methoxyphenol hydroxylase-like FAD-dependent oxidoreductase